ncbi:hypothetical protein [Vibrio phage phiKT1028]|nr:hypothetical protein [Vibrio phage phiKT1028]
MTKSTKPNHDLWKLFIYLAEGLNEMTFFLEGTDDEGMPTLNHTGVAHEDMHITIQPHAYLPMTHIHMDINLPVELTDALAGDLTNNPVAIRLRDYLTERGSIDYLVYNEMAPNILKEIADIQAVLHEQERPNLEAVQQMIHYLSNLMMNELDAKVAKKANRYYPLAINRLPRITVDEPSEEWIERTFGDMMSGDVFHAGHVVVRNAKRVGRRLGNIAEMVNRWGKETQTEKDFDLWFSLNIEDHKISLGLDRQPYQSEESFVIERTPVNMDEWDDAVDLGFIHSIQKEIDEMNITIANLLNYNTGYEMLNKEIEQLYIRNIHHPVAKHTVRVWEFDDLCPSGRAKIDEEIAAIMQLVEDKATELDAEVKLDISNMYLHQKAEGENFILNQEHQVVAKRCQTYAGTFFDSLQQYLYDVETPLFGPYTHVTPADLGNQTVISETDLLDAPTLH